MAFDLLMLTPVIYSLQFNILLDTWMTLLNEIFIREHVVANVFVSGSIIIL